MSPGNQNYFYMLNAQNAAAQQNCANIYTTTYGANTITGTASGLGSLGMLAGLPQGGWYQQAAIQGIQHSSTGSLQEFVEKVSKPAKRAAKGILAKLQSEIDDWHGDILERCPA